MVDIAKIKMVLMIIAILALFVLGYFIVKQIYISL